MKESPEFRDMFIKEVQLQVKLNRGEISLEDVERMNREEAQNGQR
jgi:hypothetical protein